jgi:hypothetical protein
LNEFFSNKHILSSDMYIPSTELCTGSIHIHNQKCWLPIWIAVSSIMNTDTLFPFIDLTRSKSLNPIPYRDVTLSFFLENN